MTDSARKRKLVEVALPLDEINSACKADKDRKTGTIRNLHKWWAPMPLPAWRALLFAALIDDPEDDSQRAYLLDLIKRLVSSGADLPLDADLAEATRLIRRQFGTNLPIVLDPFCGGGSTLVEAQRLGLVSAGSDLNPVPTLVSRTLTQILPPSFGHPPIHAEVPINSRSLQHQLDVGATPMPHEGYGGLIQDVAHYAQVLSDLAWQNLAKNYQTRPGERGVAWFWARTAQCPNPACGVSTVLTTTWALSKRKGRAAWVQPRLNGRNIELAVVSGHDPTEIPKSPKVGNGVFSCLACGGVLGAKYLRAEGVEGRLGLRMTAVLVEDEGKRVFRGATALDEQASASVTPPAQDIAPPLVGKARVNLGLYGFANWASIYTPRQWETLTCHADLVPQSRDLVLSEGGTKAYATAVSTLLGLAIGRMAQCQSSQVRWFIDPRSGGGQVLPAFARHDLAMQWDFVEPTPEFGNGSITGAVKSITSGLDMAGHGVGNVVREDARTAFRPNSLVATDPPYFDAISYADLSDYFYIWHRRALRGIHPDLYSTLASPKADELTALATRHGGDAEAAKRYFISGFTEVFHNLQRSMRADLPMLVVYASKETSGGGEELGRWSSILTAAVDSGLEVTGTWPIHGTGGNRLVGIGANAVATYVVLVCRPRSSTAATTSLSDFTRTLRRELSPAVRDLQAASILPVDLPQAAIGPGMQIFSRYRGVLDQAGGMVTVTHALRLINSALSEVLDEQEGELDPQSRFAVRWWDLHGWDPATFGEADKIARPIGIGVDDVARAQIATSQANKVQLLGVGQLERTWSPSTDSLPTAWEAVHHLVDRLVDGGGELEAARLMGRLGALQDPAMSLAYRLHDIAVRRGRTSDQERYNALISSWTELVKLAGDGSATEGMF